MSAVLDEVFVSARTFPNVLALPVSGKIGDIEIETTIEETHSDALQITEHPVESGASITDHSFKKPSEVVLKCGWSNSSLKALVGAIGGLLSGATMLSSTFVSGSNTKSDYVGGIYSQLLKMQQSRQPISISTSIRQYDNMLIIGLQVTRDQKSANVLMVQATCREIVIVSTQSKTLPPKENHKNPASTSEIENVGAKQLVPASPSPGGSVPPNEWGTQ
jgi:hypothetical protein